MLDHGGIGLVSHDEDLREPQRGEKGQTAVGVGVGEGVEQVRLGCRHAVSLGRRR